MTRKITALLLGAVLAFGIAAAEIHYAQLRDYDYTVGCNISFETNLSYDTCLADGNYDDRDFTFVNWIKGDEPHKITTIGSSPSGPRVFFRLDNDFDGPSSDDVPITTGTLTTSDGSEVSYTAYDKHEGSYYDRDGYPHPVYSLFCDAAISVEKSESSYGTNNFEWPEGLGPRTNLYIRIVSIEDYIGLLSSINISMMDTAAMQAWKEEGLQKMQQMDREREENQRKTMAALVRSLER